MNIFDKYVDNQSVLKIADILGNGFYSKMALSWIDREEMFRLTRVINAENNLKKVYHANWKEESKVFCSISTDEIVKAMVRFGDECQIVELIENKFFIWFESGEHYGVLFGDPALIKKINGDGYNRSFIEDYIEDYNPKSKEEAERVRKRLNDLADKYNMD